MVRYDALQRHAQLEFIDRDYADKYCISRWVRSQFIRYDQAGTNANVSMHSSGPSKSSFGRNSKFKYANTDARTKENPSKNREPP